MTDRKKTEVLDQQKRQAINEAINLAVLQGIAFERFDGIGASSDDPINALGDAARRLLLGAIRCESCGEMDALLRESKAAICAAASPSPPRADAPL